MPATAGVLGATALAVDHVDSLILVGVRDAHTAIAGRVHAVTDRVGGRLERRLHDGVTAAVYGGVGIGLRTAARALRAADRYQLGPVVEDDPRGRFVLSAVNGLIGDRLREERPEMCFDAALRVGGRDVAVTPAGLDAAYPGAGEKVVVFLHGLCETEDYWRRRSRPRREGEPGLPPYGERLAADHGWTPVYVRYNSGLGVAENGVAISALLGRLVESWPVPIRRIALVGHSMGGLVARAASAVAGGEAWTALVSDMVCLGTPHLGSPVARVAERGRAAFGRLPETAGVSRILAARSMGIGDLHDGMTDARNLPHARYRLVAATLTRSPRHPVALAIGDLLVQPRSALGTPRRGAEMFPGADVLHVPGAGHFDLLNHDDVYAAIAGWLSVD